MTIKEIFDREQWLEGAYSYQWHNASIDRIEKAVNERIAELEAQIQKMVKLKEEK